MSHKFDLLVALNQKSGDLQTKWGSSTGDYESGCGTKIMGIPPIIVEVFQLGPQLWTY